MLGCTMIVGPPEWLPGVRTMLLILKILILFSDIGRAKIGPWWWRFGKKGLYIVSSISQGIEVFKGRSN